MFFDHGLQDTERVPYRFRKWAPKGPLWIPLWHGDNHAFIFAEPCDATVTCVLPVLCVFLRCLAQYSMNPYVYPTGFGRCPFGCSAGPCRRRTGFGTIYGQSCRPGQIQGLQNPHVWEPLWTTHDSLWAQNRRKPFSEKPLMLIFRSRTIWSRTSPKIIEKSVIQPSLIKVFAMRLIG